LDRITFNEEHDKSKVLPSMLFILVILIYLFFRFVVDDYARSGEMWAEMATNFYQNARFGDLYHQFFATDAGYIPLLQRIIAWTVNIFKAPVHLIPYLYTWISIVLSAMMVGTFTLHYFRPLVQNDYTRMLISLIVLITISWETANFVSFTYLNLFYISIFVALALSKDNDDAPKIAFLIPILIMTKVHVLAIVPIMFLSIFFVKKRYKYIFSFTILMSILQVIQVMVSHMNGQFKVENDFSLFDKLLSSFAFNFAYLGNYIVGYGNHFSSINLLIIGIIISIFALFTLFIKKKNSNTLIIVGLSIVFFIFFINSFALSNAFNLNNYSVNHGMYRHVFPGFIGSILLLIGIAESWGNVLRYKPLIKYFSFLLIFGWTISGNLIIMGINSSKELKHRTGYSNWQTMSQSIQNNDNNMCVPINPYKWTYSKNCGYTHTLNFGKGTYKTFEETSLSINIPTDIKNRKTIALLVGIDLTNNVSTNVELYAIATTLTGNKYKFYGFKNNVSSKSMILLNNTNREPVSNIVKLELTSNIPLKYWVKNGNKEPSISWMGN
jgi:hypothetical protein